MSEAIVLPTHRGFKNLTGFIFGRLMVIAYCGVMGGGKRRLTHWLCRCECGTEKIISATSLQSGNTTSCGCLRRERLYLAHTTHGLSHSAEYAIWLNMKTRCTNPKSISYKNYGGRKIQVCERWLSFKNFLADMGPRPSKRHQLDRIDNNGDYRPGNVRWATSKQNNRNRRSNRMLEFRGELRPVAEWAEISGIPKNVVYDRLYSGWSAEDALTTPNKAAKHAPYTEH